MVSHYVLEHTAFIAVAEMLLEHLKLMLSFQLSLCDTCEYVNQHSYTLRVINDECSSENVFH